MANSWDSRPNAPPQADLNPLTNPALEPYLGRWAKVYFGNPPGKREQAVSQLLEEIRRETAANAAARQTALEDSPAARQIVWPSCQRSNPPGHKFCGSCGAVLDPATVFSHGNSASAPDQASTIRSEDDVSWLRDRVSRSTSEVSFRTWPGWKYLAGGLAVALAGLAYVQWVPKRITSLPSSGATASREERIPAAVAPAQNSRTAQAGEVTKRPEGSEPPGTPAVVKGQGRGALPGIESASQKSPMPDAFPSRQTGEGGDVDLRLAQRFLRGEMGTHDSSEAAKLLWKAVRKQNTTAAVLLSDLYVRGDGVPRSCDQARLLLLAAAKRGAPQATQQLQNLPAHGCR